MKIKRTIILSALLALAAFSAGCGSISTTSSSTDDETGTTTTETGVTTVGTAWNTDKSAAVVTDTTGTTAVVTSTSITYSSGGKSYVVYYGDDGLPTRAVSGSEIITFTWDTSSDTVDLAMIAADGSITLSRDVAVDANALAAMEAIGALFSVSAEKGISDYFTLNNVFRAGGAVLQITACGAGVSAAISTGGLSEVTGFGALACLSLMHTVAEAAGFIEQNALGDVAEIAIDAAQCATAADVVACADILVDAGELITRTSDELLVAEEAEVTSAEASLLGGGGAVKATLSWEVLGADVDLHVIDPDGEEIYYAHTTSASGGELDIDNTYGIALEGSGPAVENIFWLTDAPHGTYTVKVVYYSGDSSVDYSVIIFIDDVKYGDIHTGTLTSADSSVKYLVTTFTYPTN